MSPTIDNQPIKGTLTIKQIVAYTVAIVVTVSSVVGLYFNIIGRIDEAQKVSEDNNKILQEIRQDRKEEARMNNLRLADVESRQRTNDIRLTVIETELKR